MNVAQKAVLKAAQDAGMLPMEQSAEFMLHDLVQACIDAMRGETKAYKDLSEQQMDAVNAKLQSTLKQTVITAAHILSGSEVIKVPMLLQDFKAGKEIKLTGLIDSDDPGRYQLMDLTHQKQKVLILLQDMNYFGGLDNIKADKDQKELPIGGDDTKPASGKGKAKENAAAKPIEVAPKMLADARDFVVIQQNTTVAGLQNFLHVDLTKAQHIHNLLEEEGVLTAKDASGMRQLIRAGQTTGNDLHEQTDLNPGLGDADVPVDLTEELYQAIKETVISRQSVSVGVLMVDHALPEDTILDAIERLELDEVISPEDDMGGRTVLIPKAD